MGEEPDPKNLDLHHAVNYLSAELYTKDVHFLMELIQNAEDNEYLEGVKPSLEFVITSRDITATGASATLLLFNNEKGFSAKNIESICSVGRSTKKGNRKSGYIGEKGIGFKSVFLIASRPYVFSNGYQIRFNEEPCPHCKVGYIVPAWVDDNPTLSNIKQVYGSGTSLPATIILLPLKPDKVQPVKQQLSSIHPELLLFLSKIKRLSVKEDNKDPKLNSVTAISISSETDFATRKNIDAESFLLHLSANEKGDKLERECCYHMWRQRFPVKQENKVERRMDVEELVITLAFPNGKSLNRGMQTPGIYAFLPTEMVTNFPFIIQADFVLASSRETILLDNQWNQGILDYVPSAFINAFNALVKTVEDAPVSCLPPMFEFLPINSSPYPELNVVRETIQAKLLDENIIPCESYTEQKLFHKPSEVWRLMPAFWSILHKAKEEEGVRLHNICSHGRYVLSSSFDSKDYDRILNFLAVKLVEDEWYVNCLWVTNLVLGVSEEVYLDILLFLAEKWRTNFQRTNIRNIPLLKYVNLNGEVSLYTLNDIIERNVATVLLSCEPHQMSWLIDWNKEFRCQGGQCFLPKSTQEAIQQCSKRQTLLEWLSKELKVDAVNVYHYAAALAKSKFNDRKLVITYIHFLYHSLTKNHLSGREVKHLCGNMPLVDSYGRLSTQWKGILVPANGSKWFSLMQSNPWRNQGFVVLGEDYLCSGTFAGVYTPEKQLISFLKSHIGASDVPNVSPPDVVIPTMCLPLIKQNTFLLLDWIRNRMRKGVQLPRKFLTCIKEGSWMKISLSGSPGYRPPSQSFLPTSSWGQLLQNDSVLVDIPIIDRSYYGDEIDGYKEELGAIGVMFEYGEACQFVGKHLMSLVASSTLTRGNVLSILQFIKFLKDKFLSAEEFISSIRLGKWLKTSLGYRSPFGSVLYADKWRVASQISDIPFIDQDFYGEEILCFKTELQMLGVVISFGQNYQLVSDHLKSPADINAKTAESGLFVLQYLQLSKSSDKFVQAFKDTKFLKTNKGYMSPFGSYLLNAAWGCLLQVFNSFPSIDQNFYGNSIFLYKNELKQLGVVVDFEDAAKAFTRVFRQKSALSSISKDNVLSLLACYKKLQGSTFELPKDLKSCIRDVKWVRTRLGDYRVPRECILFGPNWESLSPISALPFIDDTDNCYGKGIHEFKEELKNIGVVFALKDGFRLVAAGLSLPPDPSTITPANVQSLLECVRNFQQQKHEPLPDSFLKKIGKEWLKTYYGYRTPGECLLFDSHWNYVLRRDDGPFIDEEFYGSKITSYAKELSAIGVTVEVRNGC
ncbi:hypothetical protein RHMOL_Rhmol12G0211000 [Rhododendron molle]|uniref:Uncharacterized protein n=1 Tax=Rhododendron molle TaxID=49168 RepID=A0ACC0LLR8_RHOML|nr:hypothetical protein RHMOL_Rhmol12G0211000 [Rhododendron molle]